MNLNLENKVFIVTGGSEGIGEEISRTILRENGIVVIASQVKEITNAMIEEYSKQRCLGVIGDLKEDIFCKKVIDETLKTFGKIDGIVNNAGVNDGVGIEAGPEKFRSSLNANLCHYYNMVHFSLPSLKKTKGSIVNISSKVAISGQGGTSGYAASKGGQLGLTREWAAELCKFSIRVNAILPAEVRTPMYVKTRLDVASNPEAVDREITSKIPYERRMTTATEIANTVTFLLSDVSSHTTGQFIYVDGGYTHLDRALT